MEMDKEINKLCLLAKEPSCSPWIKEQISNFKSQYFRNAFHKATADTDRDSSIGSVEKTEKPSGKDSPF